MSTDGDTQEYLDTAHASREQQYQEQFTAIDADPPGGEDYEQAVQDLEESILSIEPTRGFVVTISTGGPGEWLEVGCDPASGDVETVTFCVAWWSPVQRTTVNPGDALWRLAEHWAEAL